MVKKISNEPGMTQQATYHILVRGKVSDHWSSWFNGSTILVERGSAGNSNTLLTCQVRDQAELLGILNRINSLNLPLLQVKII
jgi:hypothetical protein